MIIKESRNFWMKRSYKPLKDKYDWVIMERIKKGKDRRPTSYKRIDKALYRHSKLWDDLVNVEFIKDEKAQASFNFSIFNIFTFSIIALLAVVFFGGLIYVTGLLNDVFIDVGITNEANAGRAGYTNLTEAAQNTFGKMNDSIQALRLVAITLIFSEILLFFVLVSFQRVHPALFFVYILIVILATMFAAPISNAYEELLKSSIYEGVLQSFSGANWILLHLPLITFLVGALGGIFMFINILRSGNETSL